jgi:hypothetical protein
MTRHPAESVVAEDRALLFLHIPKAAGSTLHPIFERHFAPDVTFDLARINPPESIQQLFNLPELERRKIRLLKGHMPYGLHKYLGVPAAYITMLRHPAERVVSQYYFTRRMPGISLYDEIISKNMGLADFVRKRASLRATNDQTRLISGVEKVNSGLLRGEQMRTFEGNEEAASADTLMIAKRNLANHFAVVGLSERFDESLLLIRREFGWRNVYYTKRNVTKNRPSIRQVSREVIELIEKHYELDMELYKYAQQRFEERVREQGELFERELRSFRRKNKLYEKVLRGYTLVQKAIPKMKAAVGKTRGGKG